MAQRYRQNDISDGNAVPPGQPAATYYTLLTPSLHRSISTYYNFTDPIPNPILVHDITKRC